MCSSDPFSVTSTTRPRIWRYRYGLSGSWIERAMFGFRRRFLVFTRTRPALDPHAGAAVVDPHRRHLRPAVAADGRDVGERLLAQQITVALGHHRHRPLSFSTWSRILSVNRSSSSVRRRGRRPSSGAPTASGSRTAAPAPRPG